MRISTPTFFIGCASAVSLDNTAVPAGSNPFLNGKKFTQSISRTGPKPVASSLLSQTPYSFARRSKEMKKMMEAEQDADDNIRKFQENLEALKTTVEFEPVAL